MTKNDKLIIANKFITIISNHGRRFFHHNDHVGKFKLKRGHIYWSCEYTRRDIYLSYKYWKFSHGGTMRHLVNELSNFIRGNRDLPLYCLGPWGRMHDHDLWGYGLTEMDEVRSKCNQLIREI